MEQNFQNQSNQLNNNKATCPRTWLLESILASIFCCIPLGIVGIVYAAKVGSLYNKGDYIESQKASEKAKKFTIIALITGLVIVEIYLLALFLLA